MSAADMLILYLGIALLLCCPVVLGLVGRWIEDRRKAAQTWHVAEPADVAATERDIFQDEICAVLDDCITHTERLLFAAELAEWESA